VEDKNDHHWWSNRLSSQRVYQRNSPIKNVFFVTMSPNFKSSVDPGFRALTKKQMFETTLVNYFISLTLFSLGDSIQCAGLQWSLQNLIHLQEKKNLITSQENARHYRGDRQKIFL
jgi:hypothetical protein